MAEVRITNLTKGTELAARAVVADGFTSRLVGLLGRRTLADGEGLVIRPSRSIHTMLMRFAIDVVYVDRSGAVLKTVERLRPFRVSAARAPAHAVIELPAGAVASSRTARGDQLTFEAL